MSLAAPPSSALPATIVSVSTALHSMHPAVDVDTTTNAGGGVAADRAGGRCRGPGFRVDAAAIVIGDGEVAAGLAGDIAADGAVCKSHACGCAHLLRRLLLCFR